MKKEEMSVEKYEDFLELSVKSIICKFSQVFFVPNQIYAGPILMQFYLKGNNDPNRFPKKFSKLFLANYLKKFV